MLIASLIIAALTSGVALARRVLRESDPLLIAGVAPLLGSAWLLIGANSGLGGLALLALALAPALLLARASGPALAMPGAARVQRVALAVAVALVALYTVYAQVRFLDTDNWIHEPLITSYGLGLLPPVNPYFPDLRLNGHYGRDLLVATLTPPGGDPLGTVWALNPALQVAAFLTLFASVRGLTGRFRDGILVAVMVFFGVDVGFRVGLIDTFDGNNGVVYGLLALLFHLAFRLFQPQEGPAWARWGGWILSGAVLGIYQIVYETHFGLLLLTGASLGCLLPSRRAWSGLLVVAAVALPMAAVEGGPITDLVARAGRTEQVEVLQNQGQRVSLSFPKSPLLTVRVTESTYQRTSAAFRTRLFSGLYSPPRGSGPMHILDPRFLTTHWLPLYLAPFTLAACWRRRSLPGLGLWCFGAWAYLVPGLIDFGPIYEWEYFRWEFAAGVGFAGALGLALSWWSEPGEGGGWRIERGAEGWRLHLTRGGWPSAGAALIAAGSLAAGQKLLNDMVIDLQGGARGLAWTSPRAWREQREELAWSRGDSEAARWLQARVAPGDRFLSNRADGTPLGIWPDAVFSALSGALPAGHALPPGSEGTHAAPPYHPDALARAFWGTGRVDLLRRAGIRWLHVEPARLSPGLARLLAAPAQGLRPAGGPFEGRWLFEILPGAPAPPSQPPFELTARLPDGEGLRVGRHTPVTLRWTSRHPSARSLGIVRARVLGPAGEALPGPALDLVEGQVAPGRPLEVVHSLVTPLDEGAYLFEISLPEAEGGEIPRWRWPLQVDFLTRVGALAARLDLPDSFQPRRFYTIRLGLTSARRLSSTGELALETRLRRPGGEHVWELDSIPQPLDLELEPGQEQERFFQLLTPSEPGAYTLELNVRDRATGRLVPLGQPRTLEVGG